MFTASTYANLVSASTASQERLFLQYIGHRDDFDIIIVGSGIGGGLLADDLAERLPHKRILVIEAGSFLYPTHIYNVCRFSNGRVARHFGCDTFYQHGTAETRHFIGEKPQLNFGGRSIFWSGLIPAVQEWELAFFPDRVRADLSAGLLDAAGATMNESRSLGVTARAIVARLQDTSLADDFVIAETPRALHQPYLTAAGTPRDDVFVEPTGVFNTAELMINQVGLTPGKAHGDGPGLHLILNHFVEDVQNHGSHFELVVRNTLSSEARTFKAVTVVLAAGSLESPKLLGRSSLFPWFPDHVKAMIGRGLTDHPTSNEVTTFATAIGDVPLPKTTHAKIILYSRGHRDGGEIRFPFNVEMNVNHEYWHLRENDPEERHAPDDRGDASRIDIKFSFGNCLDDNNVIRPAPDYGYVPEVVFHNLRCLDHLTGSRFQALAGWTKSPDEVFAVMNSVAARVFEAFSHHGRPAEPQGRFGENGKGFGWGTVHHAAGSLRMPYRPHLDADIASATVVDEDLRVAGTDHLYVCDMSVMPFSSAANPVRTLAALALRLSRHFS